MSRRTLSDCQWDRIKDLIRGKKTDRGVTGSDNRLFVDAVLWIARTGAPWRDLPPELGHWTLGGALPGGREWGCGRVFIKALADDPDFEYVIVNPTVVRAHQHAAGAKGGLRLRRSALARGLEHQAPYLRGRAG